MTALVPCPRHLLASLVGGSFAFLLPVGAALFTACGEDTGATTGKRVVLATEVEVAPAASAGFTNAFGFAITLDRVLVSVGELRYYAGAPIGRRDRPLTPELMGLRLVHAHPGHYVAGDELGEMLEPLTIELLPGSSSLADGQGITGEYRSASFRFAAPPVGALAGDLDDAVVLVSGTAESADLALTFEVSATREEVLDTYGEPVISGCPFTGGTVAGDGTVVLTLDPALWLDQVDFSREPDVVSGQSVVLDPAEVPHEAFVRGLKKAAAYAFSFTPNSGESS